MIYYCPVCGEELTYDAKIYVNDLNEIVGCERCVEAKDAMDVLEGKNERF